MANISYEARIDWVRSDEYRHSPDCSEWGNEEYTTKAWFRDNTSGSWWGYQCLTCTYNGDCVYGNDQWLGNRTNVNAYRIDPIFESFEDDFGSRCTYNSGDDCHNGPDDVADVYLRRAYPSSYNTGYTSYGTWGVSSNRHERRMEFAWRYSGNSHSISMSCSPQTSTQYSGYIRSQSVYLTAGVIYRFQTTSGPDTYLRLYGTNGFSIVASNDDGGIGLLSRMIYTATTTGWHYIETSNYQRDVLSSNAVLQYQIVNPTAGTATVNLSTVCNGASVQFSHSGGTNGSFDRFQYRWNNVGSWYNWGTTNPYNWTASNCGNTLYVRARVRNGSCYAYSNVVTTQVVCDPTAPTITKSPNTGSVCVGASLTVTSSGGSGGTGTCNNQYRRYNGSSWSSWSNSIPSFTANIGINRVQSRRDCNGSGCNSNVNEVSWTVVADPSAPTITKSPNVTNICEGSSLTITSSGGSGGVGCNNQYRYNTGSTWSAWSNSLPSFSSLVGTNTIESRRNCSGSGCGTVTGNTVSWTVQSAPTAPTLITGTSTICNGSSTTLTANGGSNGSGATYQWYAGGCGSGSVLGTSSTLNVSPISTTTYYVRRVGNTSCTNITACTSVPVTVDQHTTANAGTDQYSCKNSNVSLSANTPTTGTGTWSWSGPGTVSYATGNANTPNATVSFSADGTYTGTWTLDNGICASSNDNVEINTNAPDVITTTAASSGTCSSNGVNNWVHLYDVTTNKIIASVNDQGQTMGDVTVTVPTVGNASASGVCSGGLNSYMGRYYSFSSTNSGWHGNNIKVRLYFTTAELNSLIAESHTTATAPASDPNGCEDDDDVNTIADIIATKYATGSGPGGAGGILLSQDGNGTGFGASWAEFTVDGFSDIYLHGSEHAVPLPVELLSFTANAINNKYIAVEWQTATEINNDGFELLRSINGISFEKIAWIKGNGNTSNKQSYSYNDKDVKAGTYYYKLKQIDFDGKFEEFEIKSASIHANGINNNLVLRPNPTSNIITLDINSLANQKTIINVFDHSGKKVLEIKEILSKGKNSINIKKVRNLSSGIYFINIEVDNITYYEKFIVIK